MSYRSFIHGEIQYSSAEQRDAVLEKVSENGWDASQENAYHGNAIHSEEIQREENPYTIIVPLRGYTNLGQHYELFTSTATSWRFIEATNDGGLEGYINTPTRNELVDLTDWIKENHKGVYAEKPRRESFNTENQFLQTDHEWELNVMLLFTNPAQHNVTFNSAHLP